HASSGAAQSPSTRHVPPPTSVVDVVVETGGVWVQPTAGSQASIVLGSASSQEIGSGSPVQTCAWQTRAWHLSTRQGAAVAQEFGIRVCVQPLAGSQPSVVHGFPSLQSTGTCSQPSGSAHMSMVQAFESSQLGGRVPTQSTSKGGKRLRAQCGAGLHA